MASKKLDFAKGDIPEKRSDIDKFYVIAYTKAKGSAEQRKAIKEVIKNNTVERISQLTKKPYTDVKMKEVRDVFCDYFFPHLNERPGEKTFEDMLDEL